MKIFIDEKELEYNVENKNLKNIYNFAKKKIDDKIISKIYLNKIEVNENYLLNNFVYVDDIKSLEFKTIETEKLIENTLKEISNYLPKLKNGCIKTASLFRQSKLKEAHSKYNLILEGFEWYSQTVIKIIDLLNYNDIENEIKNELTALNEILKSMIKANDNDDIILLADILEYEIVSFIDDFISLNQKIEFKFNNKDE
jgi:hypothetical protein